MFSHLSFNCVLLLLLLLSKSLDGAYTVEMGQNAYLPCSYTPSTLGKLVPVCWGKGPCPVLSCQNLLLRTDEKNVNFQKSRRYELKGKLHKGNVTLTILNVTLADSGTYCCRVEIPGLMNDEKSNVELIIKPAKVTPVPPAQRNFTVAHPRMLTTEEHGSAETQTLGTLHDKNQTQKSTLASEFQDSRTTTSTGVSMRVGLSAGLAFTFIFSAFILKWYFHRKKKLQNLSLITLANPSPSGLANAAAEGMRSEENIYTIEENTYEMEDPYYCYVSSEQQC